jgi:DNA-binding PadR family transcriptional regulator
MIKQYPLSKIILSKASLVVLKAVSDATELYDAMTFVPYRGIRLSKLAYSTYYNTARRLQLRGLLTSKKQNKLILFRLTGKGRQILKSQKNNLVRRKDGFSTIIMFDIPEKFKKERVIFRRYLIRKGYTLIQKSVMVSPYQLSSETKGLIKELSLRSYIMVLSGKIENY